MNAIRVQGNLVSVLESRDYSFVLALAIPPFSFFFVSYFSFSFSFVFAFVMEQSSSQLYTAIRHIGASNAFISLKTSIKTNLKID